LNAEHASSLQLSEYPIHVVSNAADPLAYLSDLIVGQHAQQLPDLSNIVILLSNPLAARRLRQQLLQTIHGQGMSALFGPNISTLRAWIEYSTPLDIAVMSEQMRELMLIESLYRHSTLFGSGNPWHIATCLISLFDDLTLHNIELPDSVEDFINKLDESYDLNTVSSAAFNRESTLIHTLWRAWHKQQHEEGMIDRHAAYLARLTSNRKPTSSNNYYYLVGYNTLLSCETEWVRHLIEKGQMSAIIQDVQQYPGSSGQCYSSPLLQSFNVLIDSAPYIAPAPQDTYAEFLDTVYISPITDDRADRNAHMRERANRFAAAYPDSPLEERLYIYEAYDAEQEANAIDIQIRQWLIQGKKDIGVITENRRLARRLRALLERAGVNLQDPSGWALSTTSAASTLERWLETLEEDYDHQPLLDFLKSPFIFPDETPDSRLESVYRLERDIILHENIPRGLDRYRRHIEFRSNRLPWSTTSSNLIYKILDTLEYAAEPLQPYIHVRETSPAEILSGLRESLQRLGIIRTFASDEAGSRILHEIQQMSDALKNRSIVFSWTDFRTWLGKKLEYSNFIPPQQEGKVLLLNLEQSNLHRFDAVIIASANSGHLPGQKNDNPFFNDAVRRDLQLPLSREATIHQFRHYRRILECAPDVLISMHCMQSGEPQIPSPWVTLLLAFHEIAYKQKPHDNHLGQLVNHPATRISKTDTKQLPERMRYPAPAVASALIPGKFSPTMYQQLVDCPYQFYASHCLGLKAPEVIREAMEKSDFGKRVHRILQVFHGTSCGAFKRKISINTRDTAINTLTELSNKEFARDLEDNVVHRGWLKQWLITIPSYIDWQIKREAEWHVAAVEKTVVKEINAANLSIKGRLDRIDMSDKEIAIIDYKTGSTPSGEEILRGEAVQLPFYAMLLDTPVQRVEYLKIDKEHVKPEAVMEDQVLDDLQTKSGDRLKDIFIQMTTGKALPAWGDETVCSLCTVQGICRKQSWIE